MVASGKADLECANTTQTLTRLANVDFSNLIFVDGGGFLVKSDSPINQLTDMAGKKIAVLSGHDHRDAPARTRCSGASSMRRW